MHYILVVIAVLNGRFYEETPRYAAVFDTKAHCEVVKARYPTKGVRYEKAVCVPEVDASATLYQKAK